MLVDKAAKQSELALLGILLEIKITWLGWPREVHVLVCVRSQSPGIQLKVDFESEPPLVSW